MKILSNQTQIIIEMMCFEEKIIKSKIYNEEKKVGLQNDK